MSDLKRKRSSSEEDVAICDADVPYFEGILDGLAELADLKLVVEGQDLPAHSYILISKSPVLMAAVAAASSDKQRITRVPLPGESKQDVMTVLKYLYNTNSSIQSADDAVAMAKFAHKYNMSELLDQSTKYLVLHVQSLGVLSASTVFDWVNFAESNKLGMVLAHCERYIVANFSAVNGEDGGKLFKISNDSLRRIMKGLESKSNGAAVSHGNSVGLKTCYRCCKIISTPCCTHPDCMLYPTKAVHVCKIDASAMEIIAYHNLPSISTFLEWQSPSSLP